MAVARMETCEDVGELARELGVRPRCLYKWRRKLEMVEPGQEASRRGLHARICSPQGNPSLEAAFGREDPGVGFSQRCLAKKSRRDARSAAELARRHLRADPRGNVFARQPEHRTPVPVGAGQSQKFLPLAERAATRRRGAGGAICNPTDCPR